MDKVLLIDNYDSFVYNIYQYLGELGADVWVQRNNEIGVEDIYRFEPSKIVVSPGPGRPENAGISIPLVKEFYNKIPILGVCLGHQVIGTAFGAEVSRADNIMHGKTSLIHHNNEYIFKGLKNPFAATRYHSLIVKSNKLPKVFKICARTESGEIMGMKVKKHPCFGIQFHPESILTKEGKFLLKNFLKIGEVCKK